MAIVVRLDRPFKQSAEREIRHNLAPEEGRVPMRNSRSPEEQIDHALKKADGPRNTDASPQNQGAANRGQANL